MKYSSTLRKALLLGGIAFASSASIAVADTNTGLDLTQPLTSAGYSYQSTYLAPGIVNGAGSTDASLAFGAHQLRIATQSSNGTGLQYNYVLPNSSGAFRQTFGALVSLPSENTFAGSEHQYGGLYQLAYDVTPRTSVLFLATYAVGAAPAALTPRYNELTLSPSALLKLNGSSYASIAPQYDAYSGDLHTATYDAKLDVGKVFANHYNLSAFYELPLGTFTYDNRFRSAYGVKLMAQL